MNETNKFTPARMRWVLAVLAVAAAFVLGFCVILRHNLRTPVVIQAKDYTEITAPGEVAFQFSVTASDNGGALVLQGWDAMTSTRFYDVYNWVVLYHEKTGVYLRLPTMKVIDDGATEAVNNGVNYANGGFFSFVSKKELDAPLSDYEVCFAFSSKEQQYEYLVHTGLSAAEVLA